MSEQVSQRAEALRVVLIAIPLLISIALLGIAVQSGTFLSFAIGWPVIQAFGYGFTIKLAKGDIGHPLVSTQIALHWLVLALLIGLMVRGV